MKISLISIFTGGVLSFLMAVFHTQFFKIFNWKIAFDKISTGNKKVFYTIHIALLLIFLGFSFISFFYANELSSCKGLALGVNIIISLFWLWRTIWQLVYFKPDKNNKFVLMHYILIGIFFLLFISYSIPIVWVLCKINKF